jgi:hypothetical protein
MCHNDFLHSDAVYPGLPLAEAHWYIQLQDSLCLLLMPFASVQLPCLLSHARPSYHSRNSTPLPANQVQL